jgi:hypothetical protein
MLKLQKLYSLSRNPVAMIPLTNEHVELVECGLEFCTELLDAALSNHGSPDRGDLFDGLLLSIRTFRNLMSVSEKQGGENIPIDHLFCLVDFLTCTLA